MIKKRGKHFYMDVTVNDQRYREALKTTDARQAPGLERKRIAEIEQGKVVSGKAKEFSRLSLSEAAEFYLGSREGRVAERTCQLEKERAKPLLKQLGSKIVRKISAEDISKYQNKRAGDGVSNRTVNMEVGVLRRILKKGKSWVTLDADVSMLPETRKEIGRALTPEQKAHLFSTASTRPEWMVAYCAGVLAVSTTCRGVELKNLRWRAIDWADRVVRISRSKTEAGVRNIPLNEDALNALTRLHERAEALGGMDPDHFVFPACEHGRIDFKRHQKSWRTAWRSLTREAGLKGFRFHDLRHHAITELAERGTADATLMAISGHMSKRMLDHYSHVRMDAKRNVLDQLHSGLMPGTESLRRSLSPEQGSVTNGVTNENSPSVPEAYVVEQIGGRGRTRTCDLLRVKQAL